MTVSLHVLPQHPYLPAWALHISNFCHFQHTRSDPFCDCSDAFDFVVICTALRTWGGASCKHRPSYLAATALTQQAPGLAECLTQGMYSAHSYSSQLVRTHLAQSCVSSVCISSDLGLMFLYPATRSSNKHRGLRVERPSQAV